MEASTRAAAQPIAEQSLVIARQPIYNRQMGVFGYELLYRSSPEYSQQVTSGKATAHVLTSTLLSSNIDEIVYQRKAVINITRAFIDVMPQVQLPPEKLMLDIPDNVRIDDALIDSLKNLKKMGYGLSAGGFSSLQEPRLLAIADNFRIDVKRQPADQLDRLTKVLRRHNNLSLRALRIETPEEYDRYRALGYDLFQGYFLGTPRIHKVRDLSANKLAIMGLLAVVHNLNTPIEDLAEKIARDVSLSFKLLKLVNSPFFGVVQEVQSVKHAIVLLGRNEIRKLVSLLALSGVEDQPEAVIEIALLRARTCELLGKRLGASADEFFTVGMFSALDILMKQPIKKIVSKLPLSDDIRTAIIGREGVMGEALSCAVAMENARWSKINFSNMDERDLFGISTEALQWTNGVVHHF